MASKKRFQRLISILLMVCMLTSMSPMAYAGSVGETPDNADADQRIEETLDAEPVAEDAGEPEDTGEPEAAEEPEDTGEPEAVEEPEDTEEPEAVEEPEDTEEPEAEEEPEAAGEPMAEPEAFEPVLTPVDPQKVPDAEPAAEPQAETITITYASAGGTSSMIYRDTVEAGSQVTLREKTFSKSATVDNDGLNAYTYTQDGWALSNGGSKAYDLGQTITAPTGDLHLYAHYETAEQVFWTVTSGEGGTFSYKRGSGGSAVNLTGQTSAKVYVSSQRTVLPGIYGPFEAVADDGCVFDGWYINGVRVDNPALTAYNFPELTNSMFSDGSNKAEARFIPAEGKVTVKYYRNSADNDSYILYQATVDAGSAMPVPEEPTIKDRLFLGWAASPSGSVEELPETLTADSVYYAVWLEGPKPGNLDFEYTFHCVDNEGCQDHSYGLGFNFSILEIKKDGDRYVSAISVDQWGQMLSFGPEAFDKLSGKTHSLAGLAAPRIQLYWDAADQRWKSEEDCVILVTHGEIEWVFVDLGRQR